MKERFARVLYFGFHLGLEVLVGILLWTDVPRKHIYQLLFVKGRHMEVARGVFIKRFGD